MIAVELLWVSSLVAEAVIQVWRSCESSRDCEDCASCGQLREPVRDGMVFGAGWRRSWFLEEKS